jgi:ABC-type dipeptide/oligopeptide/nickel transport system permease component
LAWYLLRRLLAMVPMAAGMVLATFALLALVPGDPATVLLDQDASPESIALLRTQLGIDRPWWLRLGSYVSGVLHGDLGMSIFQHQPVSVAIAERVGATLELALAALLLATVAGVVLGVVAAVWRGSLLDVVSMLVAQLGVSMPIFWVGILLMLVFAVQLNWLPAVGRGMPLLQAASLALQGQPGALLDSLRHLALPALALGLASAAIISRLVRASMLEVLGEDYVRTATAKGLRRGRVLLVHALRAAMLPIVSVIGLRFGALLGGAVITESIFGWPGLGQLTVTAISQRDLPLVQGIALAFGLMFALLNLAVDLLYAAVDPRIRLD